MIQQALFEGRRERDRGIAKSKAKNAEWLAEALKRITAMKLAGYDTCTGEGIRNYLLAFGLAQPTSPHAWGMLTRTAVTRGVLIDTGRVVQMTDVKSHARRTPLWRLA